jgi:RNA polymerase sigma factor (sigma-70 family)
MAAARLTTVLQHLRVLATAGATNEQSDGQLLHRFAQTRDEAAFEALVRRHGPLVHGVCLRILGPGPDLDDVVQATFLVLARKASSVRKQASTGSWLHGIARRLAVRLKCQRLRRHQRERSLNGLEDMAETVSAAVDPVTCASLRELGRIVDEEVENLPTRQRDVLVLCHLEGLSSGEAASQLGCPASTVKSRLLKARALLQQRLRRRCITLSITALTLIGVEQAGGSTLPGPLLRAAVQFGVAFAAGASAVPAVSPRAALLADHVMQSVPLVRLPLALAGVLALTLLGLAALRPDPAPGAPGQPYTHAAPAVAVQQPSVARDLHGDPLPAGAVARLGTVRWRHGGLTGFVAFAPDGKSVISAGNDQVFHVWEFPSGKEIRRFGPGVDKPPPPPGRFTRSELPVALSPDGKVLACHFDGGALLLFEVASGKLLTTLGPQQSDRFFYNLAFSPDGRHLAVRDFVGVVHIWDWAKAKEVQTVNVRHAILIGEVPPMTYSPDGKWLAMTVHEFDAKQKLYATVKVVDVLKGEVSRTIQIEPKTNVMSVLFSPDSKLLVFHDLDGVIHVADPATGKELRRIQSKPRDHWTLTFSMDGQLLLGRGARQQTVCAWEVSSGKEVRNLGPVGKLLPAGNHYRLPPPAMSPNGKTLAFAGIDNALHFLDLADGKEVHGTAGNTMSLTAVGWRPDGKRLWTQGYDKGLRQWDALTGKELEPIPLPVSVYRATISPDAGCLATAPFGDRSWQIISIATGKKVGMVPPGGPMDTTDMMLVNMVFTRDGNTLAARWEMEEKEEKIQLFAMPQGKLLHTLHITGSSHDMAIDGLACWPAMFFSADGQLLAAYSAPGVLSLWDTASGQKRCSLSVSSSSPIAGGAFTPDGRCLALERKDGSVVLWELASGKVRHVFAFKAAPPSGPSVAVLEGVSFEPQAAPPINVAFSPTGRLLAYAGPDCVIRVWDVQTGQEVAVFRGHTGAVNALAFAADGKTLASASCDTTVLTWDLGAIAVKAPPMRVLTANELQARWQLLTSGDAQQAWGAMGDLAASRAETVALLSQHLQPAPALDPAVVHKLIDELDDSNFKVREQAAVDLLTLDGRAVPAVEKALAAKPPLEVKMRLEKIRDALTSLVLTEERLRSYRAIEVLERIGTPQARQLLQRLADGSPGALVTTAARKALLSLADQNR